MRRQLAGTLVKYTLLQTPGWTLAIALAWSLVTWFDVPRWAGVALVCVWIAKDLALFPTLRRFYESAPGTPRMVGDTGVAITDLTPSGLVRVRGELWHAEVTSGRTLATGDRVRVREVRGLLLIVDVAPGARGLPPHR